MFEISSLDPYMSNLAFCTAGKESSDIERHSSSVPAPPFPQIYQVGPDLVWISMGSLMRMAMYMGLHQDPNNFGHMTVKDKEIRRRLWYTILEFNVQAALDSGISPMIQESDYNTQPPYNVSDDDVENAVQEDFIPKNSTTILLPSLLAKSLPLRLGVARIINSLQEETSYDHILVIGNELAAICRNLTAAVDTNPSMSDAYPTIQFAQNYCSHLLRRFSLCLHFRYAIKAKKNAPYSHSQKVCLEAALDLAALLEDRLYSRLLVTGGGMFRDIITRGALLIFLELAPDPEIETSNSAKRRSHARQSVLLEDARRVVQYAEDRMRHGETNVKGYEFLRMMLVQAEGRFSGLLTDGDLPKSLNDGLDTCHEIL
ncbi:hypothetical protein UA08_09174 [Talaromyces atroroseus]|uniref:Xylanolytic transcriptional activator regulatory domain-containing protein n=1 Tax=Talaromyces atroroseus TaxID=1441469 RepID=A0A1Q5Q6W2_TALAT|nr:hypothetical protein UA08_09174 [Talaromyces atroroseus]OKL55585.1 hypothetical protein UA08_09174 [Talaromyces atroroseus]